jgi:hypothetical protein
VALEWALSARRIGFDFKALCLSGFRRASRKADSQNAALL